MVYQHFTLVPNMTVAENLVLARSTLPFFLDWRQEHEHLATFMKETPFHVDLASPVRSLAAGEKQKLEIFEAALPEEQRHHSRRADQRAHPGGSRRGARAPP